MTEVRHGGQNYKPTVLLITERDHIGRPVAARFVHEDQSVDLLELAAGGAMPEFIVVYACHDTWGPPPKGS